MKRYKKNKRINYDKITVKRFNLFIFLIIFLFIIVVIKLVDIMIINNNKYSNKLYASTNKYVTGNSSPRGRIFDRNGKVLVDNKSIKIISFKRDKNMSNLDMVNLCYKVSSHLDIDYSKNNDINKRKFYCAKNYNTCKSLLSKKDISKYERKKISKDELNSIMYNRVNKEIVFNFSEEDNRASYIYYLMNKGYSYDEKIIKRSASDKEFAYFAENLDDLDGFLIKDDWERVYPYGDTLRGILGSVSTSGIPKDNKDYYLRAGYSLNDRVGLSYLEKQYEEYLKGDKSLYKRIDSNNVELYKNGSRGNDIYLSIDIDMQKDIESMIDNEIYRTKGEANTEYYDHSTVIIEDPNNGEILAFASRKLKDGKIVDNCTNILTSPITPGSVVKGASILVGYNSHVISPGEYMVDECVKISGMKEKCSYHTLGKINDIVALAKSSNVYQFKTAIRVNGGEYYPEMPMFFRQSSFDTYRNMYHSFGLGVKTGIDLPIESSGYTNKDSRAGNLLDFVIGQYETYTPLQLSQYISTIAANGNRYQTHLLKEVKKDDKVIYKYEPKVLNKVNTEQRYMDRVHEGFYAVTHMDGGYGVGYLNNGLDGSGKTGTSQSFIDTDGDGVIDTETVTSSFLGYFPSNSPRYAITVTSPNSSRPSSSNFASLVTYRLTGEVSSYMYYRYF